MISMGGVNQWLFWFKTTADYFIAGGLIALGIYVALYWQNRFARIIGMMLLGAGIGWGCFAYGRTIGGAECYRQWRAANEQARIDAIKRDADISRIAKDIADSQTAEIVASNEALQKKVTEYENATKSAPDCRRATDDDIKRLCSITGAGAPGCESAKRLRPKR